MHVRPQRIVRAILVMSCAWFACAPSLAQPPQYSWRYYRPGNTGIQGDYCDAVWIGPDNDPWIGGYDPVFEEGGLANFVQSENRWVNISNVDYPVIGHPDDTGTTRVSDVVADAQGNLWMGTGRGALKFNPTVGPASLVKYGPSNSALPGGWTTNVDLAPDGTIWFCGYSTSWGGSGITRYDPATNAWTFWPTGEINIAVQPKPGGGYSVWSGAWYSGFVFRFDSATQRWTTLPEATAAGDIAALPGKGCTDAVGNTWMLRVTAPGEYHSLDYRRPDGTWVTPPEPNPASTFHIWAFRAFGDAQALLCDGGGNVWRFDGSSWHSMGQWRPGAYTEDLGIDTQGNIWACGTGGAARRDANSGVWQRYRITNTGNFDSFNRDLTIDPANRHMYTGANAGPGIGGMARFDGQRWLNWNQATYGLGWDWPFQNDSCHALAYRPSNGNVAVSPLNWLYGIHQWNGTGFDVLMPSGGAERMCDDSLGRLWALGEYYSLQYHNGSSWTQVGITAWGSKIQRDSDRAGTVWAATGHEIVRTDGAGAGAYRFSRMLDDFPELTTQSDYFSGLAADRDGVAWIGCTVQLGSGGTGGGLIRVDANTGQYQMLRYDLGWPLPGNFVAPLAVTPDGRVWMSYALDFQTPDGGGLCWYDPSNGTVGVFPGPLGGTPQWGGLPHAQIDEAEVLAVPCGYELWMSCVSRGIAVLSVIVPGDVTGDGQVDVNDLLAVITGWGPCGPAPAVCQADLTDDGVVNVNDLLLVITNWGANS